MENSLEKFLNFIARTNSLLSWKLIYFSDWDVRSLWCWKPGVKAWHVTLKPDNFLAAMTNINQSNRKKTFFVILWYRCFSIETNKKNCINTRVDTDTLMSRLHIDFVIYPCVQGIHQRWPNNMNNYIYVFWTEHKLKC